MPKEPKRKPRLKKAKIYAAKPDEEWKERFGSRMEKQAKEFSDEVRHFGEQFGRRSRRFWHGHEREWGGSWSLTFGLLGPFIASVIGIIFLAIGAWLVKIVGLLFSSAFILSLSGFIFANLHWFFLASLYFGYGNYLARRYPGAHRVFSPVIAGIGSVIMIWIAVLLLDMINNFAQSSLIALVSGLLRTNLFGIFVLIAVLGYVLWIIGGLVMKAAATEYGHVDSV